MKKSSFILFFGLIVISASAQPGEPTPQETARTFMRSGDFENAIVVLTRALSNDKNNIELQKDLVMSYYYKKDYSKALEGIKTLIDREDADVMTFQIAGNIYKALEEVKDCEKMYKKALKKFPRSGPLYSEYGELLWAAKDFSAIEQWEKGIEVDPAFSGNYYNAAVFYFYAKDKTWSIIYGEIFVNMESMNERAAAMKEMLLQAYKEKLFVEGDLMKGEEKNKNEFSRAFLSTMNRASAIANKGITTETLTMIRARFIVEWFAGNAARFPFKLFDFQRQLMQEGMFEAYNQWLFGTVENLEAYDAWTKANKEQYNAFTNFQKSRIFRMPQGQHYQASVSK